MTLVVTGSAGHLGEALMRTLRAAGRPALGLDRVPSPFTDRVGSILDPGFVADCLVGARAVVHTATLHKPHVATHADRAFLDTNVTGTLLLIQPVLKAMVARGQGRILITGSIAGHMPGSFNAVYNGTKAFIDSFAAAIANEVKDSGVTITCLKPGATDTAFFARAGMLDTKVGQMKKDDPADVARTGWEAMLKGEQSVVYGLMNQAQVLAAGVLPEKVTAELHRREAEPGSGKGA
jgi:short-subunit dehydrogenase